MTYFQAIILAIVQGITEFLPISSSGHLVILQKLFSFEKPPVLFDILVHVGTLGAILFYLRKEILESIKKIEIWWLIIVGTVPAGLVGIFLNNQIEAVFNSLDLVGVALLITALLLFSTKLTKKFTKSIKEFFLADALVIGLFQALAILPGVSRSGSTIVAGLWRGAKREAAFRFSFYLAIPAILGALLLQAPALFQAPDYSLGYGLLGMVIAGVVGFGALKVLENFLLQARLWLFGFYCGIIGLVILLV